MEISVTPKTQGSGCIPPFFTTVVVFLRVRPSFFLRASVHLCIAWDAKNVRIRRFPNLIRIINNPIIRIPVVIGVCTFFFSLFDTRFSISFRILKHRIEDSELNFAEKKREELNI